MYRKLEPAVIIKVNKLSSYSIITQFNKNHEDRSYTTKTIFLKRKKNNPIESNPPPCKGKIYRTKFEMKKNHKIHWYHVNKQLLFS